MADENTNQNEQVPDPNEERLARLEENQAVLQILGDPDVQKVILAKRAGKSVKVDEDNGQQEEKVEENNEPVDEFPELPPEDPMRKTLSQISGLIDKKLETGLKRLETLESRLSGIEGVSQNIQKEKLTEEIKSVQSQHPDFKDYRDKMLQLSKEFAGLSVHELYLLAKQRSGKLKLEKVSTQTERPTHQPRKVETKQPGSPPRPAGRKGFNDLLSEALNGLELERSN